MKYLWTPFIAVAWACSSVIDIDSDKKENTTNTTTNTNTTSLNALPICINEFMADNDSTLPIDGAYPDWIELYNPTGEDVPLDGWWISDDRQDPTKHELTGGLVVPASDGMLLFADESPAQGVDHLTFSLNVDGEEIVLTAPDGRTSIVSFGPLTGDVTATRNPDCCTDPECWTYQFAGSPGETNGVAEVVDLPLFEAGSVWRVYDVGAEPPAPWKNPGFDDSGWWTGPAPLGYGDSHIATEVSYGSDSNAKFITTYFRTTFEATDVEDLHEILIGLLRDDGAALYLNGVEVARSSLPEGDLTYNTLANVTAGDSAETTYQGFTIPSDDVAKLMVNGTNTLAVEVHQASQSSSDQGMDLTLTGQVLVLSEPVDPDDSPYELLIEKVPGLEDPSAFLFTRDIIHQIDITIPSESWTALDAYPYDYQPGSVTLDGQEVESIGIRLRGKYGSYTDLSDKPKLKIDFNRFVDNQRFFGLESLSLNNSIVDCSYLREIVAYRVFTDAGLPTPRIAFTNITVNGSDYGLYQIVDSQDDVWLKRHWADGSGNLYDGKYAMEWPWIWIGFVDFWPGYDYLFQLEEGTDVGLTDIGHITSVNTDSGGSSAYYDEMGLYLDWEQWHRHIAAEQWTGHVDGYWLNTNNYRVYFDPADGRAEFVTWDLDYSMYYDWEWSMNWSSPASYISYFCRVNDDCYANQESAAQWLVSELDIDSIEAEFNEAMALIDERSHNDPRGSCSSSGVTSEQNSIRSWILNRNEEVGDFWGF